MTAHLGKRGLWPIVIIYLLIASLYACYTPLWQVPDEPAHYNYVRSLARHARFPVMMAGDYDQAYLEELTAKRFPSDLPIDALEYEDHQPPLYYLLATPVFWLAEHLTHSLPATVRAVRLFTVCLGGWAVWLLGQLLAEVFPPERRALAWLGTGLVAFIPQFVAMTAGINNDALVLALLWLWLWLALRYLRGDVSPWALGVVLGLLLLTKTTGYGALPLTLVLIWRRGRRESWPWRRSVRELLPLLGTGLLLGGLWWGRDVLVYGWPDVLGLLRHNAVVINQPRTSEWVARMGWRAFLAVAGRTTFHSFWGQFGWMGVVLDERIYLGLAIFTAVGMGSALWHVMRHPRLDDRAWLLGSSALLTVAMYVGYNLTFVQHQGRYLFPALPLFAWLMAEGLAQATARRFSVVSAALLGGDAIFRGITGQAWHALLFAVAAGGLLLAGFLPRRWLPLLGGGVILALVALDGACLFWFIVPQLGG